MGDIKLDNLYKMWDRLRAGRLAPFSGEMDSEMLAPFVDFTFEIEPHGENFRIRRPGALINEMTGAEAHGKPAVSLMRHESRTKLVIALKKTQSTTTFARITLHARGYDGAEFGASLLLLPLRSDFGVTDRILCGISLNAQHFLPPLEFSIADIQATEFAQTVPDSPALPGFFESAAPFHGQNSPALHQVSNNPTASKGESRGQFRVIKGGRNDDSDI